MAKKSGTSRNKTSANKNAMPVVTALRYDLDELPTAQHKAGLAGLLLQIDSMRQRRDAGGISSDAELPEIVFHSERCAEIRVTEKSTQLLFDDVFDAKPVEQLRRQRHAKKEPKDIREVDVKDPRTGRIRKEKQYVYDFIQPIGHFLHNYMEGEKEAWHKLWRDMLFAGPRNRPTTRLPFNARAAGRSVKEGSELWKAIVCHSDQSRHVTTKSIGVGESIMLAAQSATAEAVKWEDRADLVFLLYFWQLSCCVFQPQRFAQSTNTKQWHFHFDGYVVAVPEIRDLAQFCNAYKKTLGELSSKQWRGRPKDAVISMPAQGSLEFIRQIDEVAQRQAAENRVGRFLSSVDFYHLIKEGQNTKLASFGRLAPDDSLLAAYRGIRTSTHNATFQAARIGALLGRKPWFAELSRLFHRQEWSFFVHSTQDRHNTPSAMVGFAYDAGRAFSLLVHNYQKRKEAGMPNVENAPHNVDWLVYELVRTFVRIRACKKAGVSEDDKDWWKKTAEERRNVSSKLFLELRSRRGDDFVRHFTATLGSVPQWLTEPRFISVTSALMRRDSDETGENRPRTQDDIKTLTLLALSAASRSLRDREDDLADVIVEEELE